MRCRSRSHPGSPVTHDTISGTWWSWPYPADFRFEERAAPVFAGYDGWSQEICIDEVHNRSRDGKYHCGGPFDMQRCKITVQPVSVSGSVDGPTLKWSVAGTVYPIFYGCTVPVPAYMSVPPSAASTTRSHGAKAWNRFKPGKPKIQSSVFLAELRDLPSMLQRKAYAHRNIGKHYLSAQFGWIPFLSDIRKMYQTQQELGKIMRNIQTMNGKWSLRHGTVVRDVTPHPDWEFRDGYIPVFQPLVPNDFSHVSTLWCKGHAQTSERVWFSGRFRYYIPDLPSKLKSNMWKLNTVRKIMGLTMTPADVWEAIPWSWLVDYFTNVGDILSNISDGYVDDVVASYAYVMRQHTTYACQYSGGKLRDGTDYGGTIEFVSETKCRQAADPFGFEVSGDLSSRQLAILAALGISRM